MPMIIATLMKSVTYRRMAIALERKVRMPPSRWVMKESLGILPFSHLISFRPTNSTAAAYRSFRPTVQASSTRVLISASKFIVCTSRWKDRVGLLLSV